MHSDAHPWPSTVLPIHPADPAGNTPCGCFRARSTAVGDSGGATTSWRTYPRYPQRKPARCTTPRRPPQPCATAHTLPHAAQTRPNASSLTRPNPRFCPVLPQFSTSPAPFCPNPAHICPDLSRHGSIRTQPSPSAPAHVPPRRQCRHLHLRIHQPITYYCGYKLQYQPTQHI